MWRPIKTAPLDASLVDLWCEYYDEDGKLYEAERRTDCHYVDKWKQWVDGEIRLGGGYTDIRITHWMPLPQPPRT